MDVDNRKPEITVAIILGLFLVGYVLSWFRAYSLSRQFLEDAEAAYARGDYLDSFMGYEEIQPATGQRLEFGGYYDIVHMWRDEYAWPKPSLVEIAEGCIEEVIASDLTIPDGELFVQENIGLNNPYFADVYLRLGELYEESGDKRTASEIYRDVIKLFPEREDIIARAEEHLTVLQP